MRVCNSVWLIHHIGLYLVYMYKYILLINTLYSITTHLCITGPCGPQPDHHRPHGVQASKNRASFSVLCQAHTTVTITRYAIGIKHRQNPCLKRVPATGQSTPKNGT